MQTTPTTNTDRTGRSAKVVFHLPTKPFNIIDAINRIAAATGSVRSAIASENSDYNGHRLGLGWNDYRGYYICEYQWGQRVVITRTPDPREAIAASIREYERQGRGASLVVGLREEDAHIAAEFPQLVEGTEGTPAFFTWKNAEVNHAIRGEQQLGIPYTKFLIEATDEEDYKARVDAEIARRRGNIRISPGCRCCGMDLSRHPHMPECELA